MIDLVESLRRSTFVGDIMPAQSILIVDDEPNQRFMFEQALRTLDNSWNIMTVGDSLQALKHISLHIPDLVITDYNMPSMNGLELINAIRANGIAARIILMTAYSSPEVCEVAQQLHVDHFLTKPVPLTLLRHLTAMTLRKAALKHAK